LRLHFVASGPSESESDRELSPEDWHDSGSVSLRPVLVVGCLLLLAGFGYLGYSCVQASERAGTFTDEASHYAPGSVTYVASGRTYLVRTSDGAFLALSEVEADDTDRVAGCVIRYLADLSIAGETGLFRDDCHGVVFSRNGSAIDGAAPPMQRHLVLQSSENVKRLTYAHSGAPRAARRWQSLAKRTP
jgi:hypothetical protein